MSLILLSGCCLDTAVKQISVAVRPERLAAASIRSRVVSCNCEILVLMSWTYTGNDKLARAATQLYERRPQPCKISPLVFMSDPERVPDVLAVAQNLPEGATLIYRHFGAVDRLVVAEELRQIAFAGNLQFLIGQDIELAKEIGADGVHLPERDLPLAAQLRTMYPNWLISAAVHSPETVRLHVGKDLDAVIASPVFPSKSKSAGVPMGKLEFSVYVSLSPIGVFALGGISTQTVDQLVGGGAAGIAGISMFAGNHGQ